MSQVPGTSLTYPEFEAIWAHSVALLQRGFTCGSILTVDPEEAKALGKPKLRRYIYNSKWCGRCGGAVVAWDMAGRTCYACPACQPLGGRAECQNAAEPAVFPSHCVRDTDEDRLAQPAKLTVPELKTHLKALGLALTGRKAELVQRLAAAAAAQAPGVTAAPRALPAPGISPEAEDHMLSAAAAAAEKRAAGESRAVEHVAEDAHDVPFVMPEGEGRAGPGRRGKAGRRPKPHGEAGGGGGAQGLGHTVACSERHGAEDGVLQVHTGPTVDLADLEGNDCVVVGMKRKRGAVAAPIGGRQRKARATAKRHKVEACEQPVDATGVCT